MVNVKISLFMLSVHIQIEVRGSWCNEWPDIAVTLNDKIYFKDKVQNDCVVDFTAPVLSNNTLIIQHYNKKFGENGQWDTQSDKEKIIRDRAVELIGISLDDVSIYKYFVATCPFITNNGDSLTTNYYGFNGSVQFNFSYPVYDWIICNIVKPKTTNFSELTIETSNESLFNYRKDQEEINEIEHILKSHANLFGKSS